LRPRSPASPDSSTCGRAWLPPTLSSPTLSWYAPTEALSAACSV
jgi:hypothetical protein